MQEQEIVSLGLFPYLEKYEKGAISFVFLKEYHKPKRQKT